MFGPEGALLFGRRGLWRRPQPPRPHRLHRRARAAHPPVHALPAVRDNGSQDRASVRRVEDREAVVNDDMPNLKALKRGVREAVDDLFSPTALVLGVALLVILGFCLLPEIVR